MVAKHALSFILHRFLSFVFFEVRIFGEFIISWDIALTLSLCPQFYPVVHIPSNFIYLLNNFKEIMDFKYERISYFSGEE